MPVERPRKNHIWLGLSQNTNVQDGLHLEIPISVINQNCLSSIKYLRYLAWCILYREGAIKYKGNVVDDAIPITSRGVYSFATDDEDEEGEDDESGDEEDEDDEVGDEDNEDDEDVDGDEKDDWFRTIVDLEVIRQRSDIHSSKTDIRIDFSTKLQKRDPRCVFSGKAPIFCEGIHIIPFARGAQWLQLIIQARLKEDDQSHQPNEINDVQNGLYIERNLHGPFDSRQLVVLKTPNQILTCDDIPANVRVEIDKACSFPADRRYTAQWLTHDEDSFGGLSNNTDAAFKKRCRKNSLPSSLLLDYNYGTAALKAWGRNLEAYNRHEHCRPAKGTVVATSAPFKPRTQEDHDNANAREVHGNFIQQEDGNNEQSDILDADTLVLKILLNRPSVRARFERQRAKEIACIMDWAMGISASG